MPKVGHIRHIAYSIGAAHQAAGMHLYTPQGVHSSNTVYIHVRAQKGYYLEQACTKCTYKRHIAIKQEVDIHEAGDKAIEKYM